MKATRKQIVEPVTVVTLEFTEAEFKLFYDGIGATSENSRVRAGMSLEQAQFFEKLFLDMVRQRTRPTGY